MKSAEKYWISVVNLLEDKITVTNANPQLIKDDTKALNGLGGGLVLNAVATDMFDISISSITDHF